MADFGTLSLCGAWRLQHCSLVPHGGEALSLPGFDDGGWHAADVPTTVLNALVHAGVYPDPRFGLNNYLIPDASDEFNAEHHLARFSHLPDRRNPWKEPWWYRREFDVPADCGVVRQLGLNAVTYRAEVWLNGRRVAGREEIVGSFRRFAIDVTGAIRPCERNAVAILVWPPDHCGVPRAQLVPFQTPRAHVPDIDNDIMKDVCINLAAVGYDCAPTVRDRLMGIWQEVSLCWSGPLRIVDPFVRTRLPLPELSPAALTVSVEVANSTPEPVAGVLRVAIEGIVAEADVVVPGAGTSTVVLDPADHPQLRIANPRLWWPVGHGPQEMYELRAEVRVGGAVSDRRTVSFGVREVTKVLHEADGAHGLRIHVNGRRIFSRGGYLQADTLLDWSMLGAGRWRSELAYLARANLNTISFEDLPNPTDEFLDLADRMGIMIWHCFFQCHWLTRDDHPLDHDLLEACAADIVRRVRNHPSVVVYMCMNEGATRESQYRRWRRQVQELDGTRILVPSGYGDWDGRDPATHRWPPWILPDTPVGANDLAPKSYGWQDPTWYYRMVRDDRSWMFKIESGSASVPAPESLARFLPDLASDSVSLEYPLNPLWANHGANSYYKPFHEALCRRHGLPGSVPDYCRKADLLSFEQHRAMFEAVSHRRWELTSGFMQWKLNSCWPTIQWQIYDYFLRPTASYYAIRKACADVVVQLDPVDNTLLVVNGTPEALTDLRLVARVCGVSSKCRSVHRVRCGASADACTVVGRLEDLPGDGGLAIVRLELTDPSGALLADNTYWRDVRGVEHDRGAYTAIAAMPPAEVRGSWAVRPGPEGGSTVEVTARTSGAIALLTRFRVLERAGGQEILPVFWSDNYVCLLRTPGTTLRAEIPGRFRAEDLSVTADGWNTTPTTLQPSRPGR